MKKGDKLLCKKTLTIKNNGDHIIYFYNGNEYVILYTDNDFVSVTSEYKNMPLDFDCRLNDAILEYFYDYFYTKQEIRQLKLESL